MERADRRPTPGVADHLPRFAGHVDGLPARAREIARHTQLINDLVRLEALGADGELSSEQRDRLRDVRNVLGNLGIDNDTSRSSDGSAPAAAFIAPHPNLVWESGDDPHFVPNESEWVSHDQ
ncbi:MAG: hypothetical protein M3487_06435 [Actinomycetota bacterium]|nr:hypothetical protein [Actinomycetota bacterium]